MYIQILKNDNDLQVSDYLQMLMSVVTKDVYLKKTAKKMCIFYYLVQVAVKYN